MTDAQQPQTADTTPPGRGPDTRRRKSATHEERVRYHAQALEMYAAGKTGQEISQALGYSRSWFTHTAYSNATFRAEVERIDARRAVAAGAAAVVKLSPPAPAVGPATGAASSTAIPLVKELRERIAQAEQEREKLRALIEARTLDEARLRDNLAAMRVARVALVSVGESLTTGG